MCVHVRRLPPCQLAAVSMPNTPPSAIYVFAQPCDLTLSQATSTLGHIHAKQKYALCPAFPDPAHTHTDALLPSLHIIHIWPPLKWGSFLHWCKEKSHQQIPPHSSLPTTFFQPESNVYERYKRKNFRLSSAIPQFWCQTKSWHVTAFVNQSQIMKIVDTITLRNI